MAECKRVIVWGGPWLPNTAPELCQTLPDNSEDGYSWKPVCPVERCQWSLNKALCRAKRGWECAWFLITFCFHKSWESCSCVWFKQQPIKTDAFLTLVPPWRERREGIRTDLCSVCQWSHPRSHAQHCGTWPPSGLSAWPCCCGWHRAELLLNQASLSPQPGSPPATEYRSSPSLAEQAAYERHSCQSQCNRARGRGKERAGEWSQWLGFLCTQDTCCNVAN